jgi:hypothetical protein
MKTLHFQCRGEWFVCDEDGQFIILKNHETKGVPYWKFLGVSTHHWHNRIIHTFEDIWDNPELAKKGIVWDYDHGTIRIWGGSYLGKQPRITACYGEEG